MHIYTGGLGFPGGPEKSRWGPRMGRLQGPLGPPTSRGQDLPNMLWGGATKYKDITDHSISCSFWIFLHGFLPFLHVFGKN